MAVISFTALYFVWTPKGRNVTEALWNLLKVIGGNAVLDKTWGKSTEKSQHPRKTHFIHFLLVKSSSLSDRPNFLRVILNMETNLTTLVIFKDNYHVFSDKMIRIIWVNEIILIRHWIPRLHQSRTFAYLEVFSKIQNNIDNRIFLLLFSS